jgi:hypothetical protein
MEGAEEDGAVGIRLCVSSAAPANWQVEGLLEVLSISETPRPRTDGETPSAKKLRWDFLS